MLVRPFLTWGDFSVAGYLTALVMGLLCLGGLGFTSVLGNLPLWVGYVISCFQLPLVWISCSAWFTELGLNAVPPWQETIATVGNLLLLGAGTALALRRFRRKDVMIWGFWRGNCGRSGAPAFWRRFCCWARRTTGCSRSSTSNTSATVPTPRPNSNWLRSGWPEYGPTLEPEERGSLDGRLEEGIQAFAQQIAAISEAAAAGLTDYGTFCEFLKDCHSDTVASDGEEDMDRESLVQRVYSGTNWYRINGIQNTMELYDTQEAYSALEISNRKADMIRRAEQMAQPERARSLLPFSVKDSTREYGKDLAVWCVLSMVLLLSSTLVRDRRRRTRAMQWTSRRGRAILTTQMTAALCSALVLTIINLVIYAVPFLAQGPSIVCGGRGGAGQMAAGHAVFLPAFRGKWPLAA